MLSQTHDRVDHQKAHRSKIETDIDLIPVFVFLRLQQFLNVSMHQLSLHIDSFSEYQEQIDEQKARPIDEAVEYETLDHRSLKCQVTVAFCKYLTTIEPHIIKPVIRLDLGEDHLHD